jgi:hypothetical protein
MNGKHNLADNSSMSPILYQTTDWNSVDVSMHPGETGAASWRTLQYDGLRIRKVEYSENYKANHWCTLGHIVYCIEGELISELSDGRTFVLSAGMSYQVTDGVSAHRSFSRKGATLLIIDGDFLKNNKERFVNPWRM